MLKIKTAGTAGVVGGAAAAVGAIGAWRNREQKRIFTPQPGSLSDKTIVITGATTGIGLESAKRLAFGGAQVILTARNDSKGKTAVQQVLEYLKEKKIDNNKISYQVLDLDDLSQVRTAASWSIPKIDVLLNNAGIMALPERELTVDGIERQMQSNHLGHFVLASVLAPKLTPDARIINVASTAHSMANQGLLFDYMWKGEPDYAPWKSYAQTKLANILFTQELQRRIDAAGKEWTAVTLHPGVIGTDLWRNSVNKDSSNNFLTRAIAKTFMAFIKTPEEGANTQIYLAAGAEDEDVRGKYLIDCKPRPTLDYAMDEKAAKQLWEESERLSGVKFELHEPVEAQVVE